jgi:3D (Asp-Asp-Asp) domain-containing protein
MKSFPKMVTFQTHATGYYPPPPGGYASAEEAEMEGGALDRQGAPLHTLQDFLEGRAPYVSVAMDAKVFPYGALLCLPALNLKYGRQIELRVVDTGSAFKGKGTSRMDICTAGKTESLDAMVNREHLAIVLVQGEDCRKCLGLAK